MYQFVENMKSDKAFFFYRGRVALYALLKAMGIGKGDEVIAQVFTCFVVPEPVVLLEATPVYVDIDPRTFSMDPYKIEEKISEKTKAIIVQHTFGIPAEMDHILEIARRHNLWVIEDSCHALGSRYRGQEVGTFGDAAFYSFGWHKPVVLGVGGAAVVNNLALKQKMAELYDGFATPRLRALVVLYLQYATYDLLVTPALFSSLRKVHRNRRVNRLLTKIARGGDVRVYRVDKGIASYDRKTATDVGIYNQRILAFQEKRLFEKLTKFDTLVAHQKRVVSQYKESLSQIGYTPLEFDGRFEPIYYKYPLLSDRKKEIIERARQARIELSDMFVSPLYPPWHRRRWESLNYRAGMCPTSEMISDRIVPLSVHSKIGDREIDRTIALLTSF